MKKQYFSILLLVSSLVAAGNAFAMEDDSQGYADITQAAASTGVLATVKTKGKDALEAGKTKAVTAAKTIHSYTPYALQNNPMNNKLYTIASLVTAYKTFTKVYNQSMRNGHSRTRAALQAFVAAYAVLKAMDKGTGFIMNLPFVQRLTKMLPSLTMPEFIAKRKPTFDGTKIVVNSVAGFVSDNKVTNAVMPYVTGKTGKAALALGTTYAAKKLIWDNREDIRTHGENAIEWVKSKVKKDDTKAETAK